MVGDRELSLPEVEACTLPTPERPMRLAEFDDLFATAVTSFHRTGPTGLRLALTPDPQVAARAADLIVRESECCTFFTFALTATGARVQLDVTVPDAYTAVLDGLATQVARSVPSGAPVSGARS